MHAGLVLRAQVRSALSMRRSAKRKPNFGLHKDEGPTNPGTKWRLGVLETRGSYGPWQQNGDSGASRTAHFISRLQRRRNEPFHRFGGMAFGYDFAIAIDEVKQRRASQIEEPRNRSIP